MENQKHFVVWSLLIFLQLQNNVLGEITAEAVYTLLSHSIFEMKTDMEIIKRRIEKVEEKTQGMSTTVSPQLTGSVITENEEMNFKEDITMQALAIQKTLSAEKLLLRDAVENFELKFVEFKSEIQKDIAFINGSLEGKAEVMLDIVNQSSMTLENGIAQLTSDLNHTTNKLSQFLETMQTTMMSNFEDIEARIIANVTMLEREVYDMANSSAQELATGIEKLRSDWNSTTNNISEILKESFP